MVVGFAPNFNTQQTFGDALQLPLVKLRDGAFALRQANGGRRVDGSLLVERKRKLGLAHVMMHWHRAQRKYGQERASSFSI